MARWPKLISAAAILGAHCTTVRAQETPNWLRDAIEPFSSACIDTTVPTTAIEITRDELPGALRGHYRRAASAQYHRLTGSEPLYLLQATNPSREIRSACAVAVPNRRRLFIVYNAALQLEPRAVAAFGRTFNISADSVGDWIIVAISHHAESRVH